MKQEQAYKYMKEQILESIWVTDTAININEITKELNISRTPVNKALRKLEHEGYLSIIPQVGVFVKRPNEQEVYEKMLVCATIDTLTTSHAALKISNEDLDYLEKLLYKMEDSQLSYQEYAKVNLEFHSIIIHASGLNYIIDIAKEIWDYLNYVTSPYDLFSGESRKQSQSEHWMIYHSLRERDPNMVKLVMEKHMNRVVQSVKKKAINN